MGEGFGGDAGCEVDVGVGGEGVLERRAGIAGVAEFVVLIGGGWVFFELAEVGVEAEPGVAELALISFEEGEVVAGGVLVEGAGEGLAGGVVGL